MTTFMMSITTAIFALKIKCFLIAQQIEMAITDSESGWFRKGEHKHVFAYAVETACDQHVWERYIEKAEDIRHTLGNKEIYQKRKETIERIFGTAKEHHGFR